jgi:hypothetical protein
MKTRHGRFLAGLSLMLGGEWFFLMLLLAMILSAGSPLYNEVNISVGFGGYLLAMARYGLSEPVLGVLLFLDLAVIVAGAMLMIWGVISQNPKNMRAIPALLDQARMNLAPWLRPDAITGPGSSDIQ